MNGACLKLKPCVFPLQTFYSTSLSKWHYHLPSCSHQTCQRLPQGMEASRSPHLSLHPVCPSPETPQTCLPLAISTTAVSPSPSAGISPKTSGLAATLKSLPGSRREREHVLRGVAPLCKPGALRVPASLSSLTGTRPLLPAQVPLRSRPPSQCSLLSL